MLSVNSCIKPSPHDVCCFEAVEGYYNVSMEKRSGPISGLTSSNLRTDDPPYPSQQSPINVLMAFLFQKKLVCFYCGCKSAQTRTPTVRRWQCSNCEAENYLDEVPLFTCPPHISLADALHYRMARLQTPQQTTSPPMLAMQNPLLDQIYPRSRYQMTPCSARHA